MKAMTARVVMPFRQPEMCQLENTFVMSLSCHPVRRKTPGLRVRYTGTVSGT